MAEGFLKGLWGKPAQQGTGMVGLWGTATKIISKPFQILGSVGSLIKYIIIAAIVLLLYGRLKK
jgi:hypothetical protein